MFKKLVIVSGLFLFLLPQLVAARTECPNLTQDLSVSSRGIEVSVLQRFLISENVLASDLATGYYGNRTQAAVQAWQRDNGIISVGSPLTTGYGAVGPKTRAAFQRQCTDLPAPVATFSQKKALEFIKSLYDPHQQLLKECTNCTHYWLWSDQLLGQLALRNYDSSLASKIEKKMNSFGVTMRNMWATLDPDYIENTRFGGTQELQASASVWYSDYNDGEELTCSSYADVAFLKAIYRYRMGDSAGARTCYDAGKAMWDGTGMKDAGQITGQYAVYKTALGLLAQKITGYPAIGIPDNYFDRFQATNGGITTDVRGGQPSGSQNIETTAAVLFAKNPGLLPPQTTAPQPKIYQAESLLSHGLGRAESDGWSAATTLDEAGHLIYGPYATDWNGSTANVTFRMMVDNNSADNLRVVTIDIYDATTQKILAIKDITRKQFSGTFTYQDFTLSTPIAGRAGHTMETRVYWHDVSYVRVDKVTVAF